MKQPPIEKPDDEMKLRHMIHDGNNQKKSVDQPDRTELNEEINGGLSPNHGLTSSSKHPWDHKKPSDKKDHHNHPSDHNRSKKKDHDKNKPDKYDSFNPFFPLEKTDDLDYLSESRPSLHTRQSLKGHRPKKPYESETTEEADHSSLNPDKPGAGQIDETDRLDYPNESRPPQYISQPPPFTAAYHPTKHSKKPRLTDRVNLKPTKPDVYGSNKQPGSSSYNFNASPFLSPNEFRLPNSSKRPGRSPYSSSSQEYDSRDISDSPSDESKRVPRRGDIGIQNIEEGGGE